MLWCKLNLMCMLQSHAPVIFSVIIFILMHFQLSTQIRVLVLIHLQERFQISELSRKALSILVWMEGLDMYVKSYNRPSKVFHSQNPFNFSWHSVEYITKGLNFMMIYMCITIISFFESLLVRVFRSVHHTSWTPS